MIQWRGLRNIREGSDFQAESYIKQARSNIDARSKGEGEDDHDGIDDNVY